MSLFDILGYVGSTLILLGYFLVSQGAVNAKSQKYQLLNVIGSACLVIYSLWLGGYALVILNSVWLVIALVAFGRRRADRRHL